MSKQTAEIGGKNKESRREMIRRLVSEERISTQMELTEKLQEAGFAVTQATVSRDIRELRLVKIADGNGRFHYENSAVSEPLHASGKFYTMFRGSVTGVDAAKNLIVIKTHSGMAQAVCATMDNLEWQQVVGTLAGDDTVLVITHTDEEAENLQNALRDMLSE